MMAVKVDQPLVPLFPCGNRDNWTSFIPQNFSVSSAVIYGPRGSFNPMDCIGFRRCGKYQGPSCAWIS